MSIGKIILLVALALVVLGLFAYAWSGKKEEEKKSTQEEKDSATKAVGGRGGATVVTTNRPGAVPVITVKSGGLPSLGVVPGASGNLSTSTPVISASESSVSAMPSGIVNIGPKLSKFRMRQ